MNNRLKEIRARLFKVAQHGSTAGPWTRDLIDHAPIDIAYLLNAVDVLTARLDEAASLLAEADDTIRDYEVTGRPAESESWAADVARIRGEVEARSGWYEIAFASIYDAEQAERAGDITGDMLAAFREAFERAPVKGRRVAVRYPKVKS